jgi:large subunit ribosomal protein L4e
MARPLVTVQSPSGKNRGTASFPEVFLSPIRTDFINIVHTKMNKNHRQPYAVSALAGEDTSAVSWGTGRAVSRIPRVSGGGSHRSGQGAFGNMCRKGRMFAPTKVWRRWHVSVTTDQKRFATCAALAASSVAPLVMARGHRISQIPEVPLVVADADLTNISKTKDAVALLNSLGLSDEIQKVRDSRHIRAGHGKARNRKYVQAKGPLFIHDVARNAGICNALRNIPGVELANVTRLNLLRLAPGGHSGRLIIWTESAFNQLNAIFGTYKTPSTIKKGYTPPRSVLTNCDISRIINSTEVQSQLREKKAVKRHLRKINPLNNLKVMAKLNPNAVLVKRQRVRDARKLANRTAEEKKRDVKLKIARKRAEHKRNPRKAFKTLLHTPTIAPVRSDFEIGVLLGNK